MTEERDVSFRFRTEPAGAVVTQYTGDSEIVEIPRTYRGLPVQAVGSYAFFDNGSCVRRILVPGTVKKILPHAFELCIELGELVLEEGVEELGEDCLLATDVRNLYLPSTVKKIHSPGSLPCRLLIPDSNPYFCTDGYGVYEGDELICVNPLDGRAEYSVCEGTKVIRMGVFDDRPDLRTVRLPVSLEYIGEGALSNVKNQYSSEEGITDVSVDAANPFFVRDRECLFRKLSDGRMIVRWFGTGSTVVVSNDVKVIGREAFAGTNVEYISFPRTIREIAPDAFRGCPLREARVRDGGSGIVFPPANVYLLKDLLRGFGRGGKLYDFTGYDGKLDSWYPDTGRIEMILSRLRMPWDLSEERKEFYRNMISSRIGEVVRLIAGQARMDLLEELAASEFLDESSAEDALAVFREAGLHEMSAFLMRWKKEHLEKKEFDYSL